MTNPSLRALLDEAATTSAIGSDVEPAMRAALTRVLQDDVPWYLSLLMGGAAWVGALFMLGTVLGLVALALGERADLAALVLGIGLIPAGVKVRSMRAGEFARQAALVCVVAGQLLLVGAIGSMSDAIVAASLATIVSTAILIVVFDESVYRFGGTLAIVGAVLIAAFERKIPYAMGVLTAVTAVLPVVIWRIWPGAGTGASGWPLLRMLGPVAWASAVAACGLLALDAVIAGVTGTAGYPRGFVDLLLPRPWPLTTVFVAWLVWFAARVAADHGTTATDPGPLAAMAAAVGIGALTLSTPAVCGTLLLLVLGFDRRRVGLVALGAVFLVGFLGLYYYSLELSLLQKSLVLVASGTVCLAAAAFFRSRRTEGVA